MNFDPEDEYAAAEKFASEIQNLKDKFVFHEPSWNITKLDRFKQVVIQSLLEKINLDHKTNFSISVNKEGKKCLKINVTTKDWGELSVPVPIDYILSPKCPAELPLHLAIGFNGKFKEKREKLTQLLLQEKRISGKTKRSKR